MEFDSNNDIAISVVIATRNRAGVLRDTLRLMERQRLPELPCELVVVDNGSDDSTLDLLQDWQSKAFHFKSLREPKPGKSRALNRALVNVRGRLIVFADDDVQPTSTWLLEFWRVFHDRPGKFILGGRIKVRFPRDSSTEFRAAHAPYMSELFSSYDFGDSEMVVAKVPFGPNVAVASEWVGSERFNEEIGPGSDYGIDVGEETEFLERLAHRHHLQFLYIPKATVYHCVRTEQMTPDWVVARAMVYGRLRGYKKFLMDRARNRSGRVPISLFLRLARGKFIAWVARLGPRRFRVRCEWKLGVRRGQVEICRRLLNRSLEGP